MKTISLADLRDANIARQAEWCPEQTPDLSFRGNELAGETGEACNVIKKLERTRHGWRGSEDTVEHLAEELADVVITADLVAMAAEIDLDAAVARKFNSTSEKHGLQTRLPEHDGSYAQEGKHFVSPCHPGWDIEVSTGANGSWLVTCTCGRPLMRLRECGSQLE